MKTNDNHSNKDNSTMEQDEEYFRLLKEIMVMAHSQKHPILLITSVNDFDDPFLSALGCPCCLGDLVTKFLDTNPQGMSILSEGIKNHLLKKDLLNHSDTDAKKNAPAGN